MSDSWTYRRLEAIPHVEIAIPLGARRGLAAHFHDEAQAVVVLAGERSFWVRNALMTARAGECLFIPPRTAHASLPFADSVVALNLYSDALPAGLPVAVVMVPPQGRGLPIGEPHDLVLILADAWRRAVREHKGPGAQLPYMEREVMPVAALAKRAGMSREGYARAFRREHGISPRSFAQALRLNAARRLLRDGETPAAAAVAAGFADQSHLGRLFQRSFGATPGRYRRG